MSEKKNLLHPISLSLDDLQRSTEFMEGYAAGFFDGEGSVSLNIYERPKPTITMSNYHLLVLQYFHAHLFPLLEIDVLYPKGKQIRIRAWETVENFVMAFKDICIVKREQLNLMDKAVKLRDSLIKKRKERRSRKLYYEEDLKKFEQIRDDIQKNREAIKDSESLFPRAHAQGK